MRHGRAAILCACVYLCACSRTALDDDVFPQDATTDTSLFGDGANDSNGDVFGDGGVGDVHIDAILACSTTCQSGCCASDGTCVQATQQGNDQCGGQGDVCRDCGDPDAGWTCKGVCIRIGQPPCTPTTCNTCCFGDYCATGNQNAACGASGQPCDKCDTLKGEHCAELADGGGKCTGAPACNSTNCAGCCYGEICSVGTQNFACGKGGDSCANCLFLKDGYCDAGECIGSL